MVRILKSLGEGDTIQPSLPSCMLSPGSPLRIYIYHKDEILFENRSSAYLYSSISRLFRRRIWSRSSWLTFTDSLDVDWTRDWAVFSCSVNDWVNLTPNVLSNKTREAFWCSIKPKNAIVRSLSLAISSIRKSVWLQLYSARSVSMRTCLFHAWFSEQLRNCLRVILFQFSVKKYMQYCQYRAYI